MSVNIQLNFQAKNINPERAEEVAKAAQEFLIEEQGLDAFGLTVQSDESNNSLEGATAWPAIISRSYEWLPYAKERWKAVIEEANGAPCDAELKFECPDEM